MSGTMRKNEVEGNQLPAFTDVKGIKNICLRDDLDLQSAG